MTNATDTKAHPLEAMAIQILTLENAIARIRSAIDEATGAVNAREVNWSDVSRLAMFVDRVNATDL